MRPPALVARRPTAGVSTAPGSSSTTRLEIVDVASGEPRTVVRAGWLRGHSWLPDGSGSSTAARPAARWPIRRPTTCAWSGATARATASSRSATSPTSSRTSTPRGACWPAARTAGRTSGSFPIDGTPRDNVRERGARHAPGGQIQVPFVSPDGQRDRLRLRQRRPQQPLGRRRSTGRRVQQITFERDPGVTVGLPLWAPERRTAILFLRAHDARIDVCLVGRDGGAVETLLPRASRAVLVGRRPLRVLLPARWAGSIGSTSRPARSCRSRRPGECWHRRRAPDGGVLFFSHLPELPFGRRGETEVCRAAPDDGPAEVLARVANSRVPLAPRLHLQPRRSPDGRWLAVPLVDGATVDIWLIPTGGGPMRAVTDFGERPVFIGAPGLVVARQPARLRRGRRHQRRHRPARGPARLRRRPATPAPPRS